MTAHTEITGTRVLVAPEHIRGKFENVSNPERAAARLAWLASLPRHLKGREIGQALGLSKTTVNKLLQQVREPVERTPRRKDNARRGVIAGSVKDAVIAGMTWEQQDKLEARCAKTGQTMAEALVAFWAEAHK